MLRQQSCPAPPFPSKSLLGGIVNGAHAAARKRPHCATSPPGVAWGKETTHRTSQSVDPGWDRRRSEEHTSELQSRPHLVCRLPPEKKTTSPNSPHSSSSPPPCADQPTSANNSPTKPTICSIMSFTSPPYVQSILNTALHSSDITPS